VGFGVPSAAVAVEAEVDVGLAGEALEAVRAYGLHEAFEAGNILVLVRFQSEAPLHLFDHLLLLDDLLP